MSLIILLTHDGLIIYFICRLNSQVIYKESQTTLDKYSYRCNIYSHSTDNYN